MPAAKTTLLAEQDGVTCVPSTSKGQRKGIHSFVSNSHYLFLMALAFACLSFVALQVHAQGWDSLANESTLEVLTVDRNGQEYWSTFRLVVIDGKMYLRLGGRGAARIEGNMKQPFVSIKLAGQRFDDVRVIPEPEMTEQVAAAMAQKYPSDLIIRWLPHPLTVRLDRES